MTATPLLRDVARRAPDLPPHDHAAEAAVVSAVLLKSELAPVLIPIVSPVAFHRRDLGLMWGAICALHQAASKIDAVTVAGWLREHGRSKDVTVQTVAEVIDKTPAVAHAEDHARIVHDRWRLREAERLAAETQVHTRSGEATQATLDRLARDIVTLAAAGPNTATPILAGDVGREFYRELMVRQAEGRAAGVPTGLSSLDAIVHGLAPGALWIIGARPGVGKSALGAAIALNVAYSGHGVHLATLEMAPGEIFARLVSSEARVDSAGMIMGRVQADDIGAVTEHASAIAKVPLAIDGKPGITLEYLRAAATKTRDLCGGLGLIVVDYLQLMTTGARRDRSREQDVSEIARGLKTLAKDLSVPVLAMAQVLRDAEKNPRPLRMSDLRESGEIEQAADGIIMLNRVQGRDDCAIADVVKHRRGATGRAALHWEARYTRFDAMEPEAARDVLDAEAPRSRWEATRPLR